MVVPILLLALGVEVLETVDGAVDDLLEFAGVGREARLLRGGIVARL